MQLPSERQSFGNMEKELPTLNLEDSLSEFLEFKMTEKGSENEEETDGNDDKKVKLDDEGSSGKTLKRKRKQEDIPLFKLTEVFLRSFYPLSSCMTKHVVAGIFKSKDYSPAILLMHGVKSVFLGESAWSSFNKYLHLIHCYFKSKVHGRKTAIIIENSDVEVENIKTRGEQCVRFRNISKYDDKVLLNGDEFEMLVGVVPAVTRYMKQLKLAEPMVQDYLFDSIEHLENTPLLCGPVDVSIYNRLPQEVYLYRHVKLLHPASEDNDQNEVLETTILESNVISKETESTLNVNDSSKHKNGNEHANSTAPEASTSKAE